jgi:hypothetical protein
LQLDWFASSKWIFHLDSSTTFCNGNVARAHPMNWAHCLRRIERWRAAGITRFTGVSDQRISCSVDPPRAAASLKGLKSTVSNCRIVWRRPYRPYLLRAKNRIQNKLQHQIIFSKYVRKHFKKFLRLYWGVWHVEDFFILWEIRNPGR